MCFFVMNPQSLSTCVVESVEQDERNLVRWTKLSLDDPKQAEQHTGSDARLLRLDVLVNLQSACECGGKTMKNQTRPPRLHPTRKSTETTRKHPPLPDPLSSVSSI